MVRKDCQQIMLNFLKKIYKCNRLSFYPYFFLQGCIFERKIQKTDIQI